MRKLGLTLTLIVAVFLAYASPVMASAYIKKDPDLAVKPDVYRNAKKPGVINGNTFNVELDYIYKVGVYPQGDGTVKMEIALGSYKAEPLSLCINLPEDEIGLVGKKAWDSINGQYTAWTNPKTNVLSAPVEFTSTGVKINPKDIVDVYKSGGFLLEAHANTCGTKRGNYPRWSFRPIVQMSQSVYDMKVKPQLESWVGLPLVEGPSGGIPGTK